MTGAWLGETHADELCGLRSWTTGQAAITRLPERREEGVTRSVEGLGEGRKQAILKLLGLVYSTVQRVCR